MQDINAIYTIYPIYTIILSMRVLKSALIQNFRRPVDTLAVNEQSALKHSVHLKRCVLKI